MQGEEGEGVRAETAADRPDTVGCHAPVHIHCTHTRLQLRSQASEPYPQCARAHIAMSLNWAQVRVRDERKMGETNAPASSEHACATQLVVTSPLKQPSEAAAI